MIDNCEGIFTMYDITTGIFNPPDENGTYNDWIGKDWTVTEKKVTNWNNWTKAFCYWLKDKFDFKISSGSGTSLGKSGIGFGAGNYQNIGLDNDWTNDNYGLSNIEIASERNTSPFSSYVDSNNNWIGKWNGTEGFDDNTNRFDIILTSDDFNYEGIRIKYPITTTGAKVLGHGVYSQNSFELVPCVAPVVNKRLVALLGPVKASGDLYRRSYLTAIGGRNKYSLIVQWLMSNGEYTTKCYSDYNFVHEINLNYNKSLLWDENFFLNIATNNSLNFSTEGPFESIYKNFNKIKYYCSKDKDVLYLAVINDDNDKALEFCFYKNLDETSGLIIAEDCTFLQEESKAWLKEADSTNSIYSHYVSSSTSGFIRDSLKYGNYGNIIISTEKIDNTYPYIVSPRKYYLDSIDNYSGSSYWQLVKFCPNLNLTTLCKNLYLVLNRGTSSTIGEDGKNIIGKIENNDIKFKVFTFNSPNLAESNTKTNGTIFAIPIE